MERKKEKNPVSELERRRAFESRLIFSSFIFHIEIESKRDE